MADLETVMELLMVLMWVSEFRAPETANLPCSIMPLPYSELAPGSHDSQNKARILPGMQSSS